MLVFLFLSIAFGSVIQQEASVFSDHQQCIQQNCPNQWAACRKDPKCVPTFEECQKKCGINQNCYNLCLRQKNITTASEQAQCATQHCLGHIAISINSQQVQRIALAIAELQECVEKNCPNQWAECRNDTKCVLTLDECQQKCGINQNCWNLCLYQKNVTTANEEAKCAAKHCFEYLAKVVKSQASASALAQVQHLQCIQKNCANQQATCRQDARCVPTLQQCRDKCAINDTCWNLCLQQKNVPAAKKGARCAAIHCIEYLAKAIKYQAQEVALANADPQQCIEKKCSTQWTACRQDSKCIPTLHKCQKKCTIDENCWIQCLQQKINLNVGGVIRCAADNCI